MYVGCLNGVSSSSSGGTALFFLKKDKAECTSSSELSQKGSVESGQCTRRGDAKPDALQVTPTGIRGSRSEAGSGSNI